MPDTVVENQSPSSAPPATGEWITVEPTFEFEPYATSVEPARPEVAAVAHAGDRYWAMGSINGHPTVWRSDDLGEFEVAYFHDWTPQPEWVRYNSVVEFDGRILVGGSGRRRGPDGDDVERSFLLGSSDSGDTWEELELDFLSEPHQRLDNLVTVGDALIADVVNDECCERPTWQPRRTTDLVSWEPVVLPAADDDTWGRFAVDGAGTIWATAGVTIDDEPALIVWESRDDGATWTRTVDRSGRRRGLAVFPGTLYLTQSATGVLVDVGHSEPRGAVRIVGGATEALPVDTAQWGDGRVLLWGQTAPDGRFYGFANRTIRASAHYCYEDVATCMQHEAPLVTSLDGITWHDVELPDLDRFERPELFLTHNGHPALWRPRTDRDNHLQPERITYWEGVDPPTTLLPEPYPEPSVPVPLVTGSDELVIGEEYRYGWGLGGCGGMWFGDTSWVPTEEPDMVDWPILDVDIADGPSGYALGRITKVATDHIRFWVEGREVEAVDFRPRIEDPEFACG